MKLPFIDNITTTQIEKLKSQQGELVSLNSENNKE